MAHGSGPKHADQVIILPYRGYGTADKLLLQGRVLEDRGFVEPDPRATRWRNLVEFLKRIESDEVPFVRLRARLGPSVQDVQADREGYFRIELPARCRGGWHEVWLELTEHPAVRTKGRVLVPSAKARFGVISDIDDTVVHTGVERKLRMLVSLALSNARTRKPLPGVAAFYRALHAGVNPVFYVSKSPWNLYLPLVEYLRMQGLPEGPVFLRNLGLRMPRDHKARVIGELFAAYPRLPFVLVGDSGEDDPEVYAALVRRHPRRVRAIYIRSVNRKPGRLAALERLVREVAASECQLVLVHEAEAAAAHAAAEGLIQASDLRAVRSECRADAISAAKAGPSSGSLK
jgi:phosphatidate phosphatase APP1